MAAKKAEGRKWGTIALVSGGLVVTGVVAWMLLKKPAAAKTTGGGKQPAGGTNNNNTSSNTTHKSTSGSGGGGTSYASGYPLKYGSSGANVKTLQQTLNDLGNYGLVVDGKFGPKTQAALVAQTGSNTVESPDDLNALYNQAWTPNYQGSMLAAPQGYDASTDPVLEGYVPPAPQDNSFLNTYLGIKL